MSPCNITSNVEQMMDLLPPDARQTIADKLSTSWAVSTSLDPTTGRHILHVDLCSSLPHVPDDLLYAQLLATWRLIDHVTFSTIHISPSSRLPGGEFCSLPEVRRASFDDFRAFLRVCDGIPFSIDASSKDRAQEILSTWGQEMGSASPPALDGNGQPEAYNWPLSTQAAPCCSTNDPLQLHDADGWPIICAA